MDYIKCEYGRGNSRKIYIIEKPVIFFGESHEESESEDDIKDVDLYDSNTIGLESESYDDSVTEDDIHAIDVCDLNTIALPEKPKHNRKRIETNRNEKIDKREKRSTDVLPLTFSNKDQLEYKLLNDLSVIYHNYKYYDIDNIITSIDNELKDDSCRDDIYQLGFKEWFRSFLNEEELVESDENITEEDFYSLSGMFIDEFFELLTP